jgi:hypothetical protein
VQTKEENTLSRRRQWHAGRLDRTLVKIQRRNTFLNFKDF